MRFVGLAKHIVILFFLTISTSIFAQINIVKDAEYYPRNELYFQYGTPSIYELATTLSHPNLSERDITAENITFSGVAGLGYNFNLNPKVSLGIYGGVSNATADFYSKSQGKNTHEYSSQIVSYSTMLSTQWTYYQKGYIQISAGAYAGLNIRNISTDRTIENIPNSQPIILTYHLTALKVRYGNIIGGFAELGFGYRGLVNAGLSIKI